MSALQEFALDDEFENAAAGLLLTDVEGVVIRTNETFLTMTGRRDEEVVGRPFTDILEPGSQVLYDSRLGDELWTEGELRGASLRMMRADGTELPILLNARMIDGLQGPTGTRLAVFDASSRENLEREMIVAKLRAETSEASVRVLQAAAARFLEATDEDELAKILVDVVRTGFSASDVAVTRYLNDDAYQVVSGEHLRPLLDAARASRSHGEGLSPDEVFLVHNLDEAYAISAELGDCFRAARAAAYSGISITDGDTVLGSFGCLYGRPRRFDDAELTLLRALARQMGLALARVKLMERLRTMATHDELTGIPNRSAIDAHAAISFERARTEHASLALIFFDLDGFKSINDRFGHGAGDLVLRTVAKRVLDAVRADDVVGRFGGDEFLIVCRDADAEIATAVAERIVARVALPVDGLPPGVGVTASVGIATLDGSGGMIDSAEALARAADAAMYESKRERGGRITVAS